MQNITFEQKSQPFMKIIWIFISFLRTTEVLEEKDPMWIKKIIFTNKTKHCDICKVDSRNIDNYKYNLLKKNRNYANYNNNNNKPKQTQFKDQKRKI